MRGDEFAWRDPHPREIQARRAAMSDELFFDILLQLGGVEEPASVYPPTDAESLTRLLDEVDAMSYDSMKRDCLVYYLLKWQTDGQSAVYSEEKCISPHYVALADAYWMLDTGTELAVRVRFIFFHGSNFLQHVMQKAIALLSDARIVKENASKVMETLALAANSAPLIRKFVRLCKPALTEQADLERYLVALAESSLLEAWQFQRSFPEGAETRRLLIRRLLTWTLTRALRQLFLQFGCSLLCFSQTTAASSCPAARRTLIEIRGHRRAGLCRAPSPEHLGHLHRGAARHGVRAPYPELQVHRRRQIRPPVPRGDQQHRPGAGWHECARHVGGGAQAHHGRSRRDPACSGALGIRTGAGRTWRGRGLEREHGELVVDAGCEHVCGQRPRWVLGGRWTQDEAGSTGESSAQFAPEWPLACAESQPLHSRCIHVLDASRTPPGVVCFFNHRCHPSTVAQRLSCFNVRFQCFFAPALHAHGVLSVTTAGSDSHHPSNRGKRERKWCRDAENQCLHGTQCILQPSRTAESGTDCV